MHHPVSEVIPVRYRMKDFDVPFERYDDHDNNAVLTIGRVVAQRRYRDRYMNRPIVLLSIQLTSMASTQSVGRRTDNQRDDQRQGRRDARSTL